MADIRNGRPWQCDGIRVYQRGLSLPHDIIDAAGDVGKNPVEDLLSNKELTNVTNKGTYNYVSPNKGNDAAKIDFESLHPENVRTYPGGTIGGDLPDGRTINLHPSSSLNGVSTVEIFDPVTNTRIKIR